VLEWQLGPLDAVYAIVYLDCIVIKIRQDKHVINKAVYLALGVNLEGHKELLGLWISHPLRASQLTARKELACGSNSFPLNPLLALQCSTVSISIFDVGIFFLGGHGRG
jgi:hypothetical protein